MWDDGKGAFQYVTNQNTHVHVYIYIRNNVRKERLVPYVSEQLLIKWDGNRLVN